MKLVGTSGQQARDLTYGFAGTITTGGTAQLLLPEHKSRSFFMFCNLSNANLFLEFGAARATCTISAGSVTSGGFTITNAGFNYTTPPEVVFLGGGNSGASGYLGVGDVTYPAPGDPGDVWPRTMDLSGQKPARGVAVLGSSSIAKSQVNSISLIDPGAGYNAAPLVFMRSSLLDPFGVAIPSATSGLQVAPNGGTFYVNGTVCFTDAVAVFGATTGQAFYVRFMP